MKNFRILLSRNTINPKLLCIAILILLNFSCEKDHNPRLDFEFQTIEVYYYPDKHISMTFNIIPKSDKGPFLLKWFNPDSLKEEGPYTINLSDNLMLDFEILDAQNISQRFTYEIETDTIDSLKYDYRNNYIGTYSCDVTSSYEGSTKYYQDTLIVIKNNAFNMLNILTRFDIINNYEGNKMTYLNSNGYVSYPTGEFYGYHSGVSFSNDSIHYSVSGPLGFYYTNTYEGIRLNQ
jgi:hypothetical protein